MVKLKCLMNRFRMLDQVNACTSIALGRLAFFRGQEGNIMKRGLGALNPVKRSLKGGGPDHRLHV